MADPDRFVTLKGNPLTLTGHKVKVGDKAPDFEVVNNDLNPVKFSSLPKKVYVLASVPSLDTPTRPGDFYGHAWQPHPCQGPGAGDAVVRGQAVPAFL